MRKIKHVNSAGLLFLVVAFIMTGFFLLSFAGEKYDFLALLFAVTAGVLMLAVYVILIKISRHADRFVIIVADLLIGIGLLIQYRLNTDNAFRQLLFLVVGIILMFIIMALIKNTKFFEYISWPLMIVSIAVLSVLFFVGKEVGGARNWIIIAAIQFQPSEFVKLAFVVVLADWLTDRYRFFDLIIPMIFVFMIVGILMLERDLGAAVLLFGTSLIMFYVATGRKGAVLTGVGIGAIGAVGSYYLFDHVKARVAIWLNPWATYTTNGYQIAQGLMAIATGGMWGVGLGVGSPKLIPMYNNDYIFAVICEEFGVIFGILLIAFYLVLVIRGAIIALNATEKFYMLLSFGCTTIIALQSIIIIGGVIKMIPLTGITLPFVSQGGSSMIACLMMLGVLEGVSARSGMMLENRMAEIEEEMRTNENEA